MNIKIQNNQEKPFKKYYRPIQDIIQKPKNRIYTTTILSFLTISLFAWYAIRPTVQTILSLRKEIQESIKVNEKMETKIINLIKAQEFYQNNFKRFSILNQAIPQTPQIVELMITLKELANASNLKVINMSTDTTDLLISNDKKNVTNEELNTLSENNNGNNIEIFKTLITMSVEGKYENIRLFILEFQSLTRIVEIVDMSLTQKFTVDGNIVAANVKIQAYSMRVKGFNK